MNKKTTGILVLAGLIGLCTAIAIYMWMQKHQEDVERNRTDVVRAVVQIKPRTVIERKMVAIHRINKADLAQHAAVRLEDVVGKVTLEGYKVDDQIRTAGLTSKDKVPGLSYLIPEGKRALTIKVDDVKGVGYSVHPGDRADILATYRDPITGQQLTQIILQRLEVLAIDEAQMDTSKGGKGAAKCVTFAVTPEEAAKLTVTDMEGALRMILRPDNDKGVVDLKAIRLRDLVKPYNVPSDSELMQPPPGSLPIGDREPPKVRVFRGSEPVKEITVSDE
jgi:pilus assembly protein CpaB